MSILRHFPELKKRLDNGEKICVAICTPMYGGIGMVDFFICLMDTLNALRSEGINAHFLYLKYESLIQRGRNTLCAKALAIPETTHIFFIDGDIQWNEYDVFRLLDDNKELIGGIYPKKSYKWTKLDELDLITKKCEDTHNTHISKTSIIKHNLLNYNYNGEITYLDNSVSEFKHIATGFMMINRTVFEKMIAKHPEWKYNCNLVSENEIPFLYAFFECGIVDNRYLSEDYMFCHRWKQMNGKIYGNTSIALNHIGTITYEGRLASTLSLNNKES